MYLVDDLAECLYPENCIKWMTRQYKLLQIKYLRVKSVCHCFLKISLKKFAVRNRPSSHEGQPKLSQACLNRCSHRFIIVLSKLKIGVFFQWVGKDLHKISLIFRMRSQEPNVLQTCMFKRKSLGPLACHMSEVMQSTWESEFTEHHCTWVYKLCVWRTSFNFQQIYSVDKQLKWKANISSSPNIRENGSIFAILQNKCITSTNVSVHVCFLMLSEDLFYTSICFSSSYHPTNLKCGLGGKRASQYHNRWAERSVFAQTLLSHELKLTHANTLCRDKMGGAGWQFQLWRPGKWNMCIDTSFCEWVGQLVSD